MSGTRLTVLRSALASPAAAIQEETMAAQASAQTKRPTMEEILASPRSTFVDVEHMAWTASKFPGVDVKILYQDESTGMLTVLTRMAPGSFIPLHIHTDIEQTYVLEGS